MNILITQTRSTETSTGIEATCGKITGAVHVTKWGYNVLCINAAHRAWRGGGRHFPTLEAALEAYKSPEMRAIIQAAADHRKFAAA